MMNKHWPYFLLVFIVPLLLIFWWWGAFTSPTIETLSRPALRYAYLISEGDYSKVDDEQRKVSRLLKQQNIIAGRAVTLIENDPRSTPGSKRRAQAGIMLADDAPTLKPPLLEGKLSPRKVIVISARGHPFVTYGKAYGALLKYLEKHDMVMQLPIVETTRDSTLSIEMTL